MSILDDIVHPDLLGSGAFGIGNVAFPSKCRFVQQATGATSGLLNAPTTGASSTVFNDVPCQITPDVNGLEVPDVGTGTVRKTTHKAQIPASYAVAETMQLVDESNVIYNIVQVARDALNSKTILRLQRTSR